LNTSKPIRKRQRTSALFLLTSGAIVDQVVDAMKGQTFEILSTNLPKEKEAELRAAFGAE
jgi:uncharacterized membrane protein